MIHGHVKVAPDGTVYLPNSTAAASRQSPSPPMPAHLDRAHCSRQPRFRTRSIGGNQQRCASRAGCFQHDVFVVHRSGSGGAATDNHAFVAMTKDRGLTWSTPGRSLAPQVGVKNAVFSSAVAGDSDRAAVAFLGTTTGGNHQDANFKGIWYGFIATTYDGGRTWTTVNATTNGPVQREACIWNGGRRQSLSQPARLYRRHCRRSWSRALRLCGRLHRRL
jgi:hypothetical protein